jgi:hypothetical protein
VHLESKSLERLLEALDSRHLSGWYHPAMRLQAQLHSVEGSNAVLREQLRSTRYGHFCTPSVSLYSYILWRGVTLCYMNSCSPHSMVTSVLLQFLCIATFCGGE